jgi:hypothetical protein
MPEPEEQSLGVRTAVHLAYAADWSVIVPFGNELAALRHAVEHQMLYKRATYGENLLSAPSAVKPAKRRRRSAAQIEADRLASPPALVDQKALARFGAPGLDAHAEALARNTQIKAEHAAADHVAQDLAAELVRDEHGAELEEQRQHETAQFDEMELARVQDDDS